MIRHMIHFFILAIFAILIVGCNSTSQPIAPPNASIGGTQSPGSQLPTPTPPPVPNQPDPGTNDPLVVELAYDLSVGKVPLRVVFTSNVTGGVPPYKYFWDFDSNGTTDSVDPNPSGLYASPGIYMAKLTIEDSVSAQGVATVEIEAKFPTPNARPEALPLTGAAPLNVSFIAQNSSSQAGASIVEYKWDFQPDGIWDYTSTSTGNTSFVFDSPGNYYPVLFVKDNLGYTEEASLHIIVTF